MADDVGNLVRLDELEQVTRESSYFALKKSDWPDSEVGLDPLRLPAVRARPGSAVRRLGWRSW